MGVIVTRSDATRQKKRDMCWMIGKIEEHEHGGNNHAWLRNFSSELQYQADSAIGLTVNGIPD